MHRLNVKLFHQSVFLRSVRFFQSNGLHWKSQSLRKLRKLNINGFCDGNTICHYGTNGTNPSSSRVLPLIKWLFEEAKRYWIATKSIWYDFRKARKIKSNLLIKPLVRSEIRFVQRAEKDFRLLIPYVIFLMIPGSTYVFPFLVVAIVKWFPHLFPMAYWTEKQKATHIKQLREFRLANYKNLIQIFNSILHSELSTSIRSQIPEESQDLRPYQMFESLATVFEQKITLSDWSSEQMRLLARYYDIPLTFVPTTRLRRKLLERIIHLRQDDKYILESGIETLSDDELQEAIRERGFIEEKESEIQANQQPINREYIRHHYISLLQNWMKLSTNNTIPHTLLIYYAISNAFVKIPKISCTEKQ